MDISRIVIIFFVVAVIVMSSVLIGVSVNKKVAQNEYAIVANKYTMELVKVLEQGTYTVKPGDELNYYRSTVQTLNYDEFEGFLHCFSSDGLQIQLDITVQYLYKKDILVPILLKQFGNEKNYVSAFKAIVIDAILTSCANFTSDEYYTSRQNVENLMSETIVRDTNTSQIGIDVSLVQLKNIDFPDQFNQAIAQKQHTAQELQTQLNNRTSQLILANTTLIQAQQSAQQIIIQAHNTENLVIVKANTTSDIIRNQLVQRGDAYANIKTNLGFNSTQFVEYIEADLLRTSNNPLIGLN